MGKDGEKYGNLRTILDFNGLYERYGRVFPVLEIGGLWRSETMMFRQTLVICARLAAMISPLIYEAAVLWTGSYLFFFLFMAALCLSNLYMAAQLASWQCG